MKTLVRDFLMLLPALFAAAYLGGPEHALAASTITVPGNLCGEGAFPCARGDTGAEQLKYLMSKLVMNVRYLIGAMAVIVIVISGVKLVSSQGNEEVFTKESTALLWSIVGLGVIALAGELAEVFSAERGGFLRDPNVAIQKTRLIKQIATIAITFIKYIIGSVAILLIVRNGLRLVLLGGNEDEVGKDKKNIFYGLFGLVLIIIANPIINEVFFKIDTSVYPGTAAVEPKVDTKAFLAEIAGMTNVVVALAGPFALLSLVAGGLMYTFGAGEEERVGKAKKIIIWSLIGLAVIYGAFALVNLFVLRNFVGI